MEDTPEGTIQELRWQAVERAAEDGVLPEETLEGEAAAMLQEFLDALRAVARGEMDAAAVRDLIDPVRRMVRAVKRD